MTTMNKNTRMTGGLAAPMTEDVERPAYPSWEDLASIIGLKLQLESALAGEAAALDRVAELEAQMQEGLQMLDVAAEEADEIDGVMRGDGIRHAGELLKGATGGRKVPEAASDIAAEILRKHLGPAMLEDAINRLAKHILNGDLLAATDPAAFLDCATAKLQCIQELALWTQEPCLSRDSKAYVRAMDDVLGKMRALGLVEEGK